MEKEFYNYKDLNLIGEDWRDVVGYEEIYEVSNFGRIRTKFRVMYYDRNLGRGVEKKTVYPKIRKPKLNKHTGYLMVGMNGKGRSANVTIHSMVARAFIENYKPEGIGRGKCVNHKDGNKLNNNLENLEVVTVKSNIQHAFKIGLGCSHKVKYRGVFYYSKAELRRVNEMTEKKMKRLIENGEIEIVQYK